MDNKIILITGGCRSGKSSLAEKIAKSYSKKRCYIATAPVFDEEMSKRVERHKLNRANDNWLTIEEELDLLKAIKVAGEKNCEVVLVDCLTLWINNLLYHAEKAKVDFTEDMMIAKVNELINEIKLLPMVIVFVINEVGLGLVPESKLARLFRDCSGRTSQAIAKVANEVYFSIASISQRIK